MISNQVISVTDLRTNTAQILDSLRGIKYIFVNNKPKSVIMDVNSYEQLQKKLKREALLRETEYAEKHGKRYKNVDDIMDDLLS